MARRNRPNRPGENPFTPPPSGGGGGGGGNNRNNNRPNNPNNRNRNRGGGGGAEDPAPETPPPPATGSSTFAGQDPKAFFLGMLQNAGFTANDPTGLGNFLQQQAQAFADQWGTYQTQPGNANADFYQFARNSGLGIPESYLTPNPPDNTLGHTDVSPVTPDWNTFQQQLIAKINQFGPQGTGQYDTGTRPGSTRYNLFG